MTTTKLFSDEIETEKEVIVENYKSRQNTTFQFLETTPSMWKMAEILGVKGKQVSFNIPLGYDQVSGISKMHPEILERNLLSQMGTCELCGHGIMYPFPILCDSKKIFMYVGSECVNNFKGAEFVKRKIIEFTDNIIRKIFKAWRGIAITESWNNPNFYDVVGGNTYAIYGKTAIKKTIWDFQNKLSKLEDFKNYSVKKSESIKKSPFDSRKDINELTTRKVLNLFKKGKELGFSIPNEIKPFLISRRQKN